MQLKGWEWMEDAREEARRATLRLISQRIHDYVDRHLAEVDERGEADRRNGFFSRHLLTELGDIVVKVPQTRTTSAIGVLKAFAHLCPLCPPATCNIVEKRVRKSVRNSNVARRKATQSKLLPDTENRGANRLWPSSMIVSYDTISRMRAPPFELTSSLLESVVAVERLLGRFEGLEATKPRPQLRKRNRVRTVHGSVAIEGNTLSIEQVTAVLDGKHVVGSRREILEVKNAIAAYELAPCLRATSERDFLRAHGVLLRGLVERAGQYRSSDVGIMQGARVAHVAPPYARVAALMAELFQWFRESTTPMLIKAAVLHYEVAFIHPFVDGNGRIARLWQHVALLEESPAFEFMPVESIIRAHQDEYYEALGRSDQAGSSTHFLEFSLRAVRDALGDVLADYRPERPSATDRLDLARQTFGTVWFTRSNYLALHKTVSTATASRDLRQGVDRGLLEVRGERRLAQYRFRRHRRSKSE